MRAALGQRDHPDLGERALALVVGRFPEPGGVVRLVRGVEGGAVHRDQPPRPVERPRGVRGGDRHAHPVEQRRQHRRAQPGAGLGDRRRGRHPPCPAPPRRPRQPRHELAHHLLVALRGEQRQRHHVVHDQPRRQQPRPLLSTALSCDDLIHRPGRERPGQHPDPHPIRQPITRPGLDLTSSGHPRTLPDHDLSYRYCPSGPWPHRGSTVERLARQPRLHQDRCRRRRRAASTGDRRPFHRAPHDIAAAQPGCPVDGDRSRPSPPSTTWLRSRHVGGRRCRSRFAGSLVVRIKLARNQAPRGVGVRSHPGYSAIEAMRTAMTDADDLRSASNGVCGEFVL